MGGSVSKRPGKIGAPLWGEFVEPAKAANAVAD